MLARSFIEQTATLTDFSEFPFLSHSLPSFSLSFSLSLAPSLPPPLPLPVFMCRQLSWRRDTQTLWRQTGSAAEPQWRHCGSALALGPPPPLPLRLSHPACAPLSLKLYVVRTAPLRPFFPVLSSLLLLAWPFSSCAPLCLPRSCLFRFRPHSGAFSFFGK